MQKERKLDTARTNLGEGTADVYHECDKFEAQRPVLFLEEFRAVRSWRVCFAAPRC